MDSAFFLRAASAVSVSLARQELPEECSLKERVVHLHGKLNDRLRKTEDGGWRFLVEGMLW